jgi:hypothetical protein
MPNWCFNYATITCPTKEIYDKLVDAIVQDKWFETFVPLNLDPEVYKDGWNYHKAVDKWSTKWAAHNVEILDNDDDILILNLSFETAWSPPLNVYKSMKKDFGIETNCIFEEPGCCFFGKCIYSKECETEDLYDMPSNEEELQELQKQIGSELDDYMSSTWEQLREDWNEDENEDENECENECENEDENECENEDDEDAINTDNAVCSLTDSVFSFDNLII